MNSLYIFVLVSLVALTSAHKSRARQNFFCNGMFNAQIKKEFDASHVYLSLSNHFAHDSVALHGFSRMFHHNWKEEQSHAENLMNYVTKRGGRICLPVVDKPAFDTKWNEKMNEGKVCDIIKEVLDLEKSVDEHLRKVHACARGDFVNDKDVEAESETCSKPTGDCTYQNCNDLNDQAKTINGGYEDPQAQDFIEGNYLNEQVESIKEIADLYTRLERVGCNGLGVHLIDQELASKYK